MNKAEERTKDIYRILKEANIYADGVYYQYKNTKYPFEAIEIIIDGDWKHEHLYTEDIMKQNGYMLLFKEVIESDGSDNYTANYVFTKWDW